MTHAPMPTGAQPGYHADIHARFLQRLEDDRAGGRLQEWMTSWYWKELFPQFGDSQTYKGPGDLVRWVVNQSRAHRYPTPPDLDGIAARAALQEAGERAMFADPLFSRHQDQIDRIDFANHAAYSAQDFHFQSLPFAGAARPGVVLDFGAGCGRMARQWIADGATAYVGVEGIPETYCLQHLYYSFLDAPLHDYAVDPEFAFAARPGSISHVPSWRTDLLPTGSVDLCCAVQVLGELRPQMLEFIVSEFRRLLRPGGFLYVRDHGKVHVPNKMDIPHILSEAGFSLTFEAGYVDRKALHGIPKLWRRAA